MQIPHLKGLVLIGGRSSRMGFDKSRIHYHGIAQVDYLARLLSLEVRQIHISGRKEQAGGSDYEFIEDVITDRGPMNGVLSAFRYDPESAWLIAACDMPLLSQKTIHQLVAGRDPEKMATCFYNVITELPEPLLSIWEPEAYLFLQKQIKEGNQSLRDALKLGNSNIIKPDHPDELLSANTEEEMMEIMDRIRLLVDGK
jgi:molybdopterin-guanine dinucleotide biosynthesis protein A